MGNFGTVEVGRQNHYKVTVNENEIFDDSYFEVELYFPNEDGNNIGFAWNFNEPAGPAGSCYGNMGICLGDLDCADFSAAARAEDVYNLPDAAVPRCRFAFVDCLEPERETTLYGSGAIKLNRLRAGTYWFNVFDNNGARPQFSEYVEGVDYTLKFHLRRSTPLNAERVMLGKVYDLERSQQYRFAVPQTPTDFRFIVDGVHNGQVTMYVECGRPAGRCPCGTFFDSCVASTFGTAANDTVCEVYVPSCACDAEDMYVSIYGDAEDNAVATAKNLEAECYYNTLLDGQCSISTQVCRNYLKTLACLTVFPQCDASGYQMPVCNAICSGISSACGDDQGLLNLLGCGADRFAMTTTGTCVANAFGSSNDNTATNRIGAVSIHDAALPQQLVTPQFAPIYATMPALILDDDDGAAKLLENFEEVKAESSSASFLVASFFLLLVVLF